MAFLDDILEDLDTQLEDFGESQVWTPVGGAATPFTGIPEISFRMLETSAGQVVSSDARVIGKKSVIGDAKKGDAVTLTDTLSATSALACTALWVENDPDDLGPGFTRLVLKKA